MSAKCVLESTRRLSERTGVVEQRHTDRHGKSRTLPYVGEGAPLHYVDQALPKIGLGTHFSDLSNIFPNDVEAGIDAFEWRAVVVERAGLASDAAG